MELNPTIPQDRFIFSSAKYPAIVAGFGAGKTEALINRAIIGKIQNPDSDRAFYEPTYDLIRMIAWPRFEEKLTELGIPYNLIKSPSNVLEIEGYGRIIFRSMDIPQRIIGYEVGDSDIDELDTLKDKDAREVWQRALSRNRQKKANGSQNTIGVATTPEGFKFVYETWQLKKLPGYEIIRAPSYSNPHLPEDYIQSLRDIYPDNLLSAYIEGDFVNLTAGTIYVGYNRETCTTFETIKEGEHLHIGMDFNVGQMSAVVHVIRDGRPYALDEVTKAYDTPDMCAILNERYSGYSMSVYPDASGSSRKTVNASLTDISILKQEGFRVIAGKTNPAVRDRINCMNAAFKAGYWVNPDKCPVYVRCLEQQVYDTNGQPDKAQGLDHLNDGAGYFIHKMFPIIKTMFKAKLGTAF